MFRLEIIMSRRLLGILAAIVLLAGCERSTAPPQATSSSSAAPPARTQAYSGAELAERTVARRGVEAVVWGMPAVNFELLYQALVQTRGE